MEKLETASKPLARARARGDKRDVGAAPSAYAIACEGIQSPGMADLISIAGLDQTRETNFIPCDFLFFQKLDWQLLHKFKTRSRTVNGN